MKAVKRKRGRPTSEEVRKRILKQEREWLKMRVASWNDDFQVGDWVSSKVYKKCLGLIISEPIVKRSQLAVYVDIIWHLREGKSCHMVETVNISRLKKFRPWPGLYGTKKKVEESP